MLSSSAETDKRRQDRRKAVLPVKVRGKDATGKPFEELAHTLDVTPAGVRLGGLRHLLNAKDPLTIWFRQRKIEFRVVWTKLLEGSREYQVGLQAVVQEGETWGLSFSENKAPDVSNTSPLLRAQSAPATA